MPLPDGGNICWPPEVCTPINSKIAMWAAWYEGNESKLSTIYGGPANTGNSPAAHAFFGSETGRGNVLNRAMSTVRRWFWGNQNRSGQPRNRLHVPIAGDIAAASADLLFSEPPAITVEDEAPGKPETDDAAKPATPKKNPTQERLDQLIDDGVHATFLEAAEIAAALGGVYLRVCWDPATRPEGPWIGAVHPDAAVPEWSFDRLVAVTFWRIISQDKQTVVRHLERHEPGLVIHGVYAGKIDELGVPMPYADYPETAWLADLELTNGNEIRTGIEGLAAVYVPNMRPNRVWRDTPGAAALGRSDYAGVEALMDSLDMTYSSWMRDVELGKARLVVPSEYMRNMGQGNGAEFELDREIYEGVSGVMGADERGMEIEQIQFKIRVDEHQRTIADLKTAIVGGAGYSAETFGLGTEGSAQTATEVASKNRRSLITRDRKTRYWRPGLQDITEALLGIDAALFHTPGIVVQRPQVVWPDAVSIDPEQQANTLLALEQAAAISTEQKVRALHPDWKDPEVDAEVELIKKEKMIGSNPLDDPTTFSGGGGFGQDKPAAAPPKQDSPFAKAQA